MFDLLVGIAAVLFWPVVIFLLIRYWRRSSRGRRQGAAPQAAYLKRAATGAARVATHDPVERP